MVKDWNTYLDKLLLEVDTSGETFRKVVDNIKASGEVVYHRPEDASGSDKLATIKSIFKYGFSREYTGKNGGNMYGTGVYNVYKLASSNEKARGYGHYIIKSYIVNGFKDFLIFQEDIAKKYYGNNWWIGNQIKLLFPTAVANRILYIFRDKLFMNNNHNDEYKKTASLCYEIFTSVGEQGMFNSKVRGFIYSGGHDGCCAFVRDFTAICPFAYSEDNGKTWTNAINPELVANVMNNIDTDFELKGKKDASGKKIYDDVTRKSINGHAIVYKNGKANYYSVELGKLISDVWFDFASNFNERGYADVTYDGIDLCLHNENSNYSVCDEDGLDICSLSELPALVAQNKSEGI